MVLPVVKQVATTTMSTSRLNLESMSNLRWVEEDLFFSIQFLLDPLTWLSIRIGEGAVISRLFLLFLVPLLGLWLEIPTPIEYKLLIIFFSFLRDNKHGNTSSRRLVCLLSFFAINFSRFRCGRRETASPSSAAAPGRMRTKPVNPYYHSVRLPPAKNPGLWSSRRTARWPASFFFFERWRINRN